MTNGVKIEPITKIDAVEQQNIKLLQLLRRSRAVLRTCLNDTPDDLIMPERVSVITRLINEIDRSTRSTAKRMINASAQSTKPPKSGKHLN